MKAITENNFTDMCYIHFEKSIAIEGHSYLVILGHHINGGFICIPTAGISCEASDQPWQVAYNAEKMTAAGLRNDIAYAIAKNIDEWISTERNTVTHYHVM